MNAEISKPLAKKNSTKIILISLIVIIILALTATILLAFSLLSHDKVYKGVYIDEHYVGGLTRDELTSLLNEKYQKVAGDVKLELKTPTSNKIFSFSDIDVLYSIPETVEAAYNIGREGNIFKRLLNIYKTGKNTEKIAINISYDNKKLEDLIQQLYDETFINVKEADLLIQEDKVIVRSGHHGENFDKADVLAKVTALLNARSGGSVEIAMIHTPPSKIDAEELYNEICIDPVDASPTVIDNQIVIKPHAKGRKIDKAVLENIIHELEKTENTEKVLPVEFINPKITSEAANKLVLKNTLAEFTTKFNTSTTNNANRGVNIKLAVSKINGKILAPGEEFSFNGIVGPRSKNAGYQVAHVYSGGKVIEGVGGGICQVSSTLYNSVLRADLEITERRNHTFTVGYVQNGCDATVSYGSVDFKFRNSTAWPVKIVGEVTSDNRVHFKLLGTNQNSGKTIEIVTETIQEIPYKTIYKNDPSLAEGKTKVLQEGKRGYVVDTYKIVKQDGKIVSQTKISTSKYSPLDEEVLKGTKKPTQTATPSPTPSPSTSPTTTQGVDDADNPPASQ